MMLEVAGGLLTLFVMRQSFGEYPFNWAPRQQCSIQQTIPAKLLEAQVEIGKFPFDGNPALLWMAYNCVVERRVNGAIRPKKAHKGSANSIVGIDAPTERWAAPTPSGNLTMY